MRYQVTLVVILLLLKAQTGFSQVSCYTTDEMGYPGGDGFFGYRVINTSQGLVGPTYGPQLPVTNTDYSFVKATPSPGQYTIVNTTRGMNTGSWYQADTRTDPNSWTYMMVVNSSVAKTAQFYQNGLGPFCANTTYTVTVWIYNLAQSGTLPNLTFTIATMQGAQRVVYNTGDVPPGVGWRNYDITFTTPNAREDLKIIMTNNNPGGNGNVFAVENVYPAIHQPIVTTLLDADNTNNATVCGDGNYTFPMHATIVNNFAHPKYQWQAAYDKGAYYDLTSETNTAFTAIYNNARAGAIRYRLSAAEGDNINCSECRTYSTPVTITVSPAPVISLIGDLTVCEGETLSLNSSNTVPNQSYEWTGPDSFSSNQAAPVIQAATAANAGKYHVVVKSAGLCIKEANVNVIINPKISVSAGSDVTLCAGSIANLSAVATPGVTYTWSPADGVSDIHSANITVSPITTTTYTVTATNAASCSATSSVTVNVTNPPIVSAGQDVTITEGEKVTLKGTIKGANVSYFWTPVTYLSQANSLTPMAAPTEEITYTLHARTENNCGAEVTAGVTIHVEKKVAIPNTFSPNSDGINDTWNITALENYPGCTVTVFNRYGQKIFNATNYPKSWDGKINGRPLTDGTYYYLIDLKNGKTLSGWVAIIK